MTPTDEYSDGYADGFRARAAELASARLIRWGKALVVCSIAILFFTCLVFCFAS